MRRADAGKAKHGAKYMDMLNALVYEYASGFTKGKVRGQLPNESMTTTRSSEMASLDSATAITINVSKLRGEEVSTTTPTTTTTTSTTTLGPFCGNVFEIAVHVLVV